MRAQRTALLRITHGSPLHREGKNSHRPLGSLCEGAGWAAKLHRLRELLPPPLRGTSLSEGGKVIWRPCCQFRPRGRLPSAAVLNLRIPALLRKSETARAKMLPLARCREKPNAEPMANVGFLFPSRNFFLSVQKEIREYFYSSFPSDCGVTEKVLEIPSRAKS